MNFKLTDIEREMPVLIPGLKYSDAEARDASGRWSASGGDGKKPSGIHIVQNEINSTLKNFKKKGKDFITKSGA